MSRAWRSKRSRLAGAGAALVICACVASTAAAQTVTAPDLKAAFLFNFARFAEWPADSLAPGALLVLCVVGDTPLAQSLDQAAKGHDIDGHKVAVWRLRLNEQVRPCHLLYAGGVNKPQAVGLLASLKGLAVFTVSDLPAFPALGGTAYLFTENGRMRFAVNVESAQRVRLHLSSQLLSLAKIVKDDPDASPR